MWYCETARMDAVDQVQLNFNPATLAVLNILIGLIMFGVALDIRVVTIATYWSRHPVPIPEAT